eukprot:TRINITY_DN438_c0_g1_i3.p1 TRINITY_DN438_c0_g1~~TRINITY_DN438_c0_g1_i3.p1  ORF type:complete len:127 (-),score=16.80 TRINITY_DN438_c0_g1_i3:369-749(-)
MRPSRRCYRPLTHQWICSFPQLFGSTICKICGGWSATGVNVLSLGVLLLTRTKAMHSYRHQTVQSLIVLASNRVFRQHRSGCGKTSLQEPDGGSLHEGCSSLKKTCKWKCTVQSTYAGNENVLQIT